ncbi:MAG: thioredoxin domain-containing protein [Propionibacteriaceae bacterium]|jgi:protein-disulfide isomerase|nr:thioredoxin domain-containing protein [Propionibacteriaceae bacterium]
MAKKKQSNTPEVTREQLAKTREAVRAAKQAEIEKDQRTKKIIFYTIIGILLAVLVFIIIWVIIVSAEKSKPTVSGGALSADNYTVNFGDPNAKVTVDLFFDFHCPGCGQFEQTNGADLKALVDDGTIYLRNHPMNFEDRTSLGTNYSSRAANAFVTVSKEDPDHALAFAQLLWDNQPPQSNEGLTDEQIAAYAVEAGVSEEITATFASMTYQEWVDSSNTAAGNEGLVTTPGMKINDSWIMGDKDHQNQSASDLEVNYTVAGALRDYLVEKANG